MRDSQIKTNKTINWAEVYSRIESTRASIENVTPHPDVRDRILRARAKNLATEVREDEYGESIEVVEFLLAHERYGFETRHVREVCRLNALTTIPGTPPFVPGIINLRGEILSVIDIRKFFELPDKGLSDLNRVIILNSRTMEFGVLADSIEGVKSVAMSDIESSLPTLTGIREEYLRGVTKDRVVILDGEKLLSDRKIIVYDEV